MTDRDLAADLRRRAENLRTDARWLKGIPLTVRIDSERRELIAAQLRGAATDCYRAVEDLSRYGEALALVRETDAALRAAWDRGDLPHDVIPSSLVKRASAFLGRHAPLADPEPDR